MNVIDGIAHEIMNDDADHDKDSGKLEDWMSTLTTEERAAISGFTAYLCGWSLDSLEERYSYGE